MNWCSFPSCAAHTDLSFSTHTRDCCAHAWPKELHLLNRMLSRKSVPFSVGPLFFFSLPYSVTSQISNEHLPRTMSGLGPQKGSRQFLLSRSCRPWGPSGCHPVLVPGKSHGWRSLIGYSPWGRKRLDTTERLHSLMVSCSVMSNSFRLYGL